MKKYLLTIFVLSLLALFLGPVTAQAQVEAELEPLIFSSSKVDLDTVFPGEEITSSFTISLVEGLNKRITYQLTKQAPEQSSLCQFLTQIVSLDGEGDTLEQAYLTSNQDTIDNWQVTLKVPEIAGQTLAFQSQDLIELLGQYNCQLILTVLSEELLGEPPGPSPGPPSQEEGEQPEEGKPGPSGGGGVSISQRGIALIPTLPQISKVEVSEIGETWAVVTWLTNTPVTSRVIYGKNSHPKLGDPPNYDYQFSTPETTETTWWHRVKITDLEPGATYFYRAVSRSLKEVLSGEYSFTTKKKKALPPQREGPEKEISELEQALPEIGIGPPEKVVPPTKELKGEEEEIVLPEPVKKVSLLAQIGSFFRQFPLPLLVIILVLVLLVALLLVGRRFEQEKSQ